MQLLENVRVVELGGGQAPSIAALLLAEAGADVLKIESPGGVEDRESAVFALRNRNKRSLVLDLDRSAERERLHDLLADADVLVHDRPPSAMRTLGLDQEALASRRPGLIAVSLLAYPEPHPKAELRAADSLALADAGVLDEQACHSRDGPAYLRLPVGSWGAAYLAVIAVAARLMVKDKGGGGGAVSTSLVQGALTSLAMYWYRAERPTESLLQGNPKGQELSLFECGDGRWIHLMTNADHVPLMKAGIEALPPELQAPVEPTDAIRRIFPLLPANRAVFRTRPAQEWLDAFWAADLAVQAAQPMGGLCEDADLVAQGQVPIVDDPVFGPCRQPARPFHLGAAAPQPKPAPKLGDAGRAWPSARPAAPPPTRPRNPEKPLEGVRVVDFGNFVAGPFGPMLAAELGADVIKVESVSGDQMRWIEWGFNGSQRGKRGLTLQLKDPRAKAVVERLAGWADIVHHNLRLPAAEKLGIGYEALRAINPRLVYCHVSAYGPLGPRKDWPGYDQLFQAMSGWEVESGGEGGRPTWLRFGMMDHQCAMASLYAALLALRAREKTGEGRFVSASLLGAAAFTMETVMTADGARVPFPRLDAAQTGVGPADRLYRCKDGWAALLADRPGRWEAVLHAFGAADAKGLEAVLAALPAGEVVARAQGCGADAAQAREQNRYGFLDDPDNRAAGMVAAYRHRDYGLLEQVGSFWTVDGRAAANDRPPPTLGQHSAEILAELGFTADEAGALQAAGVTSFG